jgi:hypothetical protein
MTTSNQVRALVPEGFTAPESARPEHVVLLLPSGQKLKVKQIDRPLPSAWTGNNMISRPVYIGAMKPYDLEDFLFKHGKRKPSITT